MPSSKGKKGFTKRKWWWWYIEKSLSCVENFRNFFRPQKFGSFSRLGVFPIRFKIMRFECPIWTFCFSPQTKWSCSSYLFVSKQWFGDKTNYFVKCFWTSWCLWLDMSSCHFMFEVKWLKQRKKIVKKNVVTSFTLWCHCVAIFKKNWVFWKFIMVTFMLWGLSLHLCCETWKTCMKALKEFAYIWRLLIPLIKRFHSRVW